MKLQAAASYVIPFQDGILNIYVYCTYCSILKAVVSIS